MQSQARTPSRFDAPVEPRSSLLDEARPDAASAPRASTVRPASAQPAPRANRTGAILVIGATGTIGSSLVPLLATGARATTIRAASRSGRLPASIAQAGVEPVALDLAAPAALPGALDGVDRIFLVSPAERLDVEETLAPVIDLAAPRGIKIVLLSQHLAEDEPDGPFARSERRLRDSGAPQVILRPNWFMDNFKSFWAADVARGVLGLPAGEGRLSLIDSRDIAACAMAALDSDRFDGGAFELTGPEALDLATAAAIWAEASGRPLRYEPIDDEAFRARLLADGVPPDYAAMLAALFEPIRAGLTGSVTDAVEQLTGQRPRTLATFAGDQRATGDVPLPG